LKPAPGLFDTDPHARRLARGVGEPGVAAASMGAEAGTRRVVPRKGAPHFEKCDSMTEVNYAEAKYGDGNASRAGAGAEIFSQQLI